MKTIALLLMLVTEIFGQGKTSTCQTQKMPNPDALDIHLETKVADEMIRNEMSPPEKHPKLMQDLLKVVGVDLIFLKHKVVTVIKSPKIAWDELLPKLLGVIKTGTNTSFDKCSELPPITKW